ncbi:MAG: Gfo/Idh/MocA family oxidoreductase [Planctomycetes bacterium]|nr:Gfo/Idh/MocA family oxidoreductase [Planctomycetota bacterium]
MSQKTLSRRDLMKGAVAAGAAFTIAGATARGQGKAVKVALIGCGGRGSGALQQHVEAARILNDRLNLGIDLKVVATADYFKDRAEGTGGRYGVPKDRCFGGPDNYKKAIESDADIILMAQSPNFRPLHLEAAVKAGKHVFMEKPAAVDPPGCRRVIEAGEDARKKNLLIVAGTQRRHERGYIETAQAVVEEKALGKLLTGRVSWCMGWIGWSAKQPIKPKTPGDLVRTWPNWAALCGDHICEQHVHNLDVANWFIGHPPRSCLGFGGSARRKAGDMWDFFSLDLDYGDGIHIHSMCRQISGCWDWVGEELVYEKGRTNCGGGLKPKESPIPAELPYEDNNKRQFGGHQQEHINMLYRLVKGLPLNEAKNVAEATAVAVMGRISAYTGQRVEWSEMMVDPKKNPEVYDLTLKPTAEDFEKGDFPMPKEIPEKGAIAAPGK